ncbi:MAG: pyridoxal phosphate-dependent aminotransferase [Acidimicrobiales bacterium]|nr:pyridoxal phosphate-dependent aminotransferase [Acidimicrobiales bacterium]
MASEQFETSRKETTGTESRISELISAIKPSATLAVDAKAKALKAKGEPVIGFGAGEPDFATPEFIVEAAIKAASDKAMHKYTPTSGLPALREAIVQKTLRDSGLSISTSQVLVTNGGKQAISNACLTLLDPGDEVLLPVPYWTTYPEAVALARAVPVEVPTSIYDDFHVTAEELEKHVTSRTKMLILNSPSNPSGAVLSESEMSEIGDFALEHGLWVLTDEIYEHLTYGGRPLVSLPVIKPEIREKCIVVNGVAKTYAMTGWRVGWMIGPNDVVEAATNLQSHTTSNVSNISQMATVAALTGDLSAVAEMKVAFERRRQSIFKLFGEITGVVCKEPEGAFYAFPSFEKLLGREIRGVKVETTVELAEIVLDLAKVAFVPGEAFGAPGYGRFSYALADADLEEGLSRLIELFSEVK